MKGSAYSTLQMGPTALQDIQGNTSVLMSIYHPQAAPSCGTYKHLGYFPCTPFKAMGRTFHLMAS